MTSEVGHGLMSDGYCGSHQCNQEADREDENAAAPAKSVGILAKEGRMGQQGLLCSCK